jgi:hypothetical protein
VRPATKNDGELNALVNGLQLALLLKQAWQLRCHQARNAAFFARISLTNANLCQKTPNFMFDPMSKACSCSTVLEQ